MYMSKLFLRCQWEKFTLKHQIFQEKKCSNLYPCLLQQGTCSVADITVDPRSVQTLPRSRAVADRCRMQNTPGDTHFHVPVWPSLLLGSFGSILNTWFRIHYKKKKNQKFICNSNWPLRQSWCIHVKEWILELIWNLIKALYFWAVIEKANGLKGRWDLYIPYVVFPAIDVFVFNKAGFLLFEWTTADTASQTVRVPTGAINVQKIPVSNHFLASLASLALTLQIKHGQLFKKSPKKSPR